MPDAVLVLRVTLVPSPLHWSLIDHCLQLAAQGHPVTAFKDITHLILLDRRNPLPTLRTLEQHKLLPYHHHHV